MARMGKRADSSNARTLKLSPKLPKTPAAARKLLIQRGCDPHQLDLLVKLVRLARDGDAPFLPTRASDVFTDPDARKLDALGRRIAALASDLSALFTQRGESFLQVGIKQQWLLELPSC